MYMYVYIYIYVCTYMDKGIDGKCCIGLSAWSCRVSSSCSWTLASSYVVCVFM